MKRRREGSLRSRAWSSLSHRLLLKAAPKVQNDLWVSREAARKKSALVPGGKGRQAGLSAGQIWYGMVCRKVCLSNAPARHPVRGRFLRASRIEANGSSRLERTPPFTKKKFARDQNGRAYRRWPRPGRMIPANCQSESTAACGRQKQKHVGESSARRSRDCFGSFACETRYRFAVWDLASLAISTDLGKVWIVLASQLCACAAGAPRAASVRGAHVPAAPLLQSVLSPSKLNSVPPRHFDISALLSHSPRQRCACSGFGGTCGSGGIGQRQRREGPCGAAWQLGACVRHPRKVLNDPHVDSHPRLFSKPV